LPCRFITPFEVVKHADTIKEGKAEEMLKRLEGAQPETN